MISEKPEESLREKKSFESEAFEIFKKLFEKESAVEEKLRLSIDFMKNALSKPDGSSLKDFWDAKKLCAPLFKKEMNSTKRNHLWSEYTELGNEARQLKEIKDEEAAFSIEQIEIAIDALEADVDHYDRLLENMPYIHFPQGIDQLSIDEEKYRKIQQELQFLKTLISRLDALRKEVLSIDMRISHKNKILKQISKLGDQVFPKRKDLIKMLSDAFIADVEAFVKLHFPEGEEKLRTPSYVIKEEIKAFQGLSKLLSLNTQAFNKSRKALSESWDKVKDFEKQRKTEMDERFHEQNKSFEELLPKVEAFEAFCKTPENQERSKILNEEESVQEAMKRVTLSREQFRLLKDRIHKARSEILDKETAKAEEKKKAARKEVEDLKADLDKLIKNESTTSLCDLEKKEEELQKIYEKVSLSQKEIHLFERNFADLKSFIFDKKVGEVAQEDLENLYEERAAHSEIIKQQMEEYRKEMGGSGLDFEKAMTYRELYDSAKIHLDNELKALENLEEKLV